MPLPTVNSAAQLQTYIDSNELLVLKFSATWCQPCKQIAPVLEQLRDGQAAAEIVHIDLDSNQDLASRYSVTSVPSVIFMHKGKEVGRVTGADVQGIVTQFESLLGLNKDAKRQDAGVDSSAYGAYIPNSYAYMNDLIFTPNAEILNTNASSDQIKDVLDPKSENAVIKSDADSQLLLYLPLQNKTKVHSLVLKAQATNDNEDEDIQLPNKIKVWANTPGPISFDDAASGVKALHQGDITFDQNNVAKVELRFVLFQNVTSLLVFLDGEDEDASTVINHIGLIGHRGESMSQGKLVKQDDE